MPRKRGPSSPSCRGRRARLPACASRSCAAKHAHSICGRQPRLLRVLPEEVRDQGRGDGFAETLPAREEMARPVAPRRVDVLADEFLRVREERI